MTSSQVMMVIGAIAAMFVAPLALYLAWRRDTKHWRQSK